MRGCLKDSIVTQEGKERERMGGGRAESESARDLTKKNKKKRDEGSEKSMLVKEFMNTSDILL